MGNFLLLKLLKTNLELGTKESIQNKYIIDVFIIKRNIHLKTERVSEIACFALIGR